MIVMPGPEWMMWLRLGVLAVVAVLTLLAFAALAVQKRVLNPFSRLARFIRGLTDWLIKPIERRIIRSGHNPQSAPWWLIGGALVLGIIAVTLANWIAMQVAALRLANAFGQQTLTFMLATWAFNLVQFALIVRIVGSWLGLGRYNPWMKPFYWATEWLLAPLRRVIPPFGPFDITPLFGWLLLALLKRLVLNMI